MQIHTKEFSKIDAGLKEDLKHVEQRTVKDSCRLCAAKYGGRQNRNGSIPSD